MFLTDKNFYESSEWDEIKSKGILYFKITSVASSGTINIWIGIEEQIDLPFGSIYTTMVSPGIKKQTINLNYNGEG